MAPGVFPALRKGFRSVLGAARAAGEAPGRLWERSEQRHQSELQKANEKICSIEEAVRSHSAQVSRLQVSWLRACCARVHSIEKTKNPRGTSRKLRSEPLEASESLLRCHRGFEAALKALRVASERPSGALREASSRLGPREPEGLKPFGAAGVTNEGFRRDSLPADLENHRKTEAGAAWGLSIAYLELRELSDRSKASSHASCYARGSSRQGLWHTRSAWDLRAG